MMETVEMNTPIFEQLCAELLDERESAPTTATAPPPEPATPTPAR